MRASTRAGARGQSGSGLIEVLIATFLAGLVAAGLLGLVAAQRRAELYGAAETAAVALAQEQLSLLRTLPQASLSSLEQGVPYDFSAQGGAGVPAGTLFSGTVRLSAPVGGVWQVDVSVAWTGPLPDLAPVELRSALYVGG
jgi:Tfp pilus assembly protein PilV